MPRSARRESASGFYHVTARGAGRKRIFEDDADRRRFVNDLECLSKQTEVELLAWCLMDNHVHLLIRAPIESLSRSVHRLTTTYACYFNGRHAHVGPVFQGRFDSLPVESDEHLLATARYIHQNPLETGIEQLDEYAWSSYREYCREARLCNTSIVLELIGGKDAFVAFCDPEAGRDYLENTSPKGPRIDEDDAIRIATACVGERFGNGLARLDKKDRDSALRKLKASGLSIRQIERLTGIGRNIIARA